MIKKYCSFMPTEIYLSKEDSDDTQTIKVSEKLDTDVVVEEVNRRTMATGICPIMT